MKKIIFYFAALMCLQTISFAQKKVLPKKLTKTIELKFSDKATEGTRGASVAWHPVQKKYYTIFAGNAMYPLAVFDAKGKLLSSDTCTAQYDTRGLWYNKKTKQIEGNTYNDQGWFKYSLSKSGLVSSIEMLYAQQPQPNAQSSGAYNNKDEKVYFMDMDHVSIYDAVMPSLSVDEIKLYLGCATEPNADDYNSYEMLLNYQQNTLVYTGQKDAEIGLLNVVDNTIELYSRESGFMTKVLELPKTIKLPDAFGFAYSNGQFWIFDTGKRKWVGYK